ncbi:MAG: hypothetical protein CFE43_17330 [Burkholderiales bacterium PBB3]|nr:MAG: hypothetical protein CFE43_17330 [Burkholderiales bacterium PBB3]
MRCVEFDILCEHKLESDLGYKQLERYIALPAARPTYLVLISNRNHVIADEVIRSPVFLKPQGAVRPYFYWEHLFPAVSNSDSRLAQDFAAYMCSLGMAPCLLEGGWKDLFADQAAAENFYAVTNRLRAVFEKQGARSQADPSRLGFQIKPQIGTIHMLYIQAARFVKPAIPALAPPHLIAKVYVKSTDTARLTARENSAFSIATGEVVGRWVGKTASWNNELILSYEYIVALNDLLAPDSAETRDRLEQFGLFLNNELFPHEEAEPGV